MGFKISPAVGLAVAELVAGGDAATVDVSAFRRSIAGVARDNQARLLEVSPLDDDLDSVFRYLVERRS